MLHHDLIRALITEVRELREQVNSLNEALEFSEQAAEYQATRYRRDAEFAREELYRERDNAQYREDQMGRAIRDLEQAERYGNDFAARQARERLSRYRY